MKGHYDELPDTKYKDGDAARFFLKGYTTDKLLVFASDGRFYTIGCDRIPTGKGFGEPVKLMVDLGENDIIDMHVHKPGNKLLVASDASKGFVVPEDEVIAQTKNGKQVLNVGDKANALACRIIEEGMDHVAVIGTNRKMLIFPLEELPEMKRGQGVTLLKSKQGKLSDAKPFNRADGLTWQAGSRTRHETDLRAWVNKRATAGRLPPVGFPRTNKFGE